MKRRKQKRYKVKYFDIHTNTMEVGKYFEIQVLQLLLLHEFI